uniref:Transmembrane protein 135 N-terminal domain-containing protein n=1 Tax=Spongospora subterranea TaxID=70186 RepID=A0A0H5RRV1_9EUKA|eukprot:CRZ11449.1 hypothetical protein [Spongospora subterranea]
MDLCPHVSCFDSIAAGFKAGVLYGAKVRFPHSLVVTLVFRRNLSIKGMVEAILKTTAQHSARLGFYVAAFKSICCLLRRIRQQTDDVFNHIIAGAITGSLIFGNDDPVSTQINLYILSRIVLASVNLSLSPGKLSPRLFAGLCWSAVMGMFFLYPDSLQSSLRSSMKTLYIDTDNMDK